MKQRLRVFPLRQLVWGLLVLALVFLSAPFPLVQAPLHALLVTGLAPLDGAPVVTALLGAGGGWAAELALRAHPHPGGLAWGDLSTALLAYLIQDRWPAEERTGFFARLLALHLVQLFLGHLGAALAYGPHPWGRGWIASLLTFPLWAGLAWRIRRPAR